MKRFDLDQPISPRREEAKVKTFEQLICDGYQSVEKGEFLISQRDRTTQIYKRKEGNIYVLADEKEFFSYKVGDVTKVGEISK